jgi:lipopolysaccharide/colanic/teichoic acid biosynthesis glycosyltransferase
MKSLKDRLNNLTLKKATPDSGDDNSSCDHIFDSKLGFYTQNYFLELLVLERKRTERSQKPIILMVIDIQKARGNFHENEFIKKMKRLLALSTRDIDIKGWYETNRLVGIIYTEINSSGADPMVNKLQKNIVELFGPGIAETVEMSWEIFPQDGNRSEGNRLMDPKFYPSPFNTTATQRVSLAFKRGIDILGSIALILLFSPFFLIIPICIKLGSPGPVFFRQKRVGQGGKLFTFLKFRSMYVNNDNTIHQEFVKNLIHSKQSPPTDGPKAVYKIQNDPRITPIGRLLRKTSLDELPQFFNTLMGDMSLVGPRPAIPYEVKEYNIWHRRRALEVKPGITGFWQVNGRSSTTFDTMARMDIQYIKRWSVLWDIKLIAQTPFSLFKGSY